MAISQQRLTLEEFLELPEEEPALEYFDGTVDQKVSPKGRHSRLQYVLAERCNRELEPLRVAMAFPELRATFGGQSLVPDVSIYRWERIPRDAQGRIADDFFEPPDVAIEIASPGQRVNSLIRRCLWYVGNGVRIALLVDPGDESIIDFRPDTQPKALRGTDPLDLTGTLPGFQLTVQQLFDSIHLR